MFGRRRNTRRLGLFGAVLIGAVGTSTDALLAVAEARQNARPPAAATEVVAAALEQATAQRKVVLIEFGASWCTWCRKFEAFVHAPDTASIVAGNYVVVNLVVQERDDKKALENPGGQTMMDRWGGAKSGLPFYVFLDASGRKIADSNAMPGGGNIGFPGNPEEAGVFLGLLEKTAPRLSKTDRAKIAGYLEASIKGSSTKL
jgi:thiol:disulfide interchange protein